MELVRKTIQNDNFMSLLDLSFGSALAIAIDCSGSMSDEIEAVKAEVIEIIAEANSGKEYALSDCLINSFNFVIFFRGC